MMYILYLSSNDETRPIEFLGIGEDRVNLYKNALNPETADKNAKSLILKWLALVKTEMSEHKRREMDYAFMYTPFSEGYYSIEGLNLYMKKIREY